MKHELEHDLFDQPTLSVELTKRGELRLSAAFRHEFKLDPGDVFVFRPSESGGFDVDHFPSRGRARSLAAYRQSREEAKEAGRQLKDPALRRSTYYYIRSE